MQLGKRSRPWGESFHRVYSGRLSWIRSTPVVYERADVLHQLSACGRKKARRLSLLACAELTRVAAAESSPQQLLALPRVHIGVRCLHRFYFPKESQPEVLKRRGTTNTTAAEAKLSNKKSTHRRQHKTNIGHEQGHRTQPHAQHKSPAGWRRAAAPSVDRHGSGTPTGTGAAMCRQGRADRLPLQRHGPGTAGGAPPRKKPWRPCSKELFEAALATPTGTGRGTSQGSSRSSTPTMTPASDSKRSIGSKSGPQVKQRLSAKRVAKAPRTKADPKKKAKKVKRTWEKCLARRQPLATKPTEAERKQFRHDVLHDQRLALKKFWQDAPRRPPGDATEIPCNDTGLPSTTNETSRRLEQRSKRGSWGMCRMCHRVCMRKLRQKDMNGKEPPPEIGKSGCRWCNSKHQKKKAEKQPLPPPELHSRDRESPAAPGSRRRATGPRTRRLPEEDPHDDLLLVPAVGASQDRGPGGRGKPEESPESLQVPEKGHRERLQALPRGAQEVPGKARRKTVEGTGATTRPIHRGAWAGDGAVAEQILGAGNVRICGAPEQLALRTVVGAKEAKRNGDARSPGQGVLHGPRLQWRLRALTVRLRPRSVNVAWKQEEHSGVHWRRRRSHEAHDEKPSNVTSVFERQALRAARSRAADRVSASVRHLRPLGAQLPVSRVPPGRDEEVDLLSHGAAALRSATHEPRHDGRLPRAAGRKKSRRMAGQFAWVAGNVFDRHAVLRQNRVPGLLPQTGHPAVSRQRTASCSRSFLVEGSGSSKSSPLHQCHRGPRDPTRWEHGALRPGFAARRRRENPKPLNPKPGKEKEDARIQNEKQKPHTSMWGKMSLNCHRFSRFFKFLLEKISWNCVEFMPKTNKMWMILIILSLFGMKKNLYQFQLIFSRKNA